MLLVFPRTRSRDHGESFRRLASAATPVVDCKDSASRVANFSGIVANRSRIRLCADGSSTIHSCNSRAPKPSRRIHVPPERMVTLERPSQSLRQCPESGALPIQSQRARELVQPVYHTFAAVAEFVRPNNRVRREKVLVHSGGIPARELVRSTR
jgi:hypothetical protein